MAGSRVRTKSKGWRKTRAKEKENENPKSEELTGLSSNCRNGVTMMPVVGTEKRNRLTEFEAVRRLRWWSQK